MAKQKLSSIAQLEEKTRIFQISDRAKSTLKRNKVQSKYFRKYAIPYYPISEKDPSVEYLLINHHIPFALLIDPKLAGFLTFMFEFHLSKHNQIEPNLRHSHGYVAYSIQKNGKNIVNFPQFNSAWGGIRKTEEYKISSNHEAALKLQLSDHIIIRSWSLYGENGMFVKYHVQMRHIYDVNYGAALRSCNVHAMLEKDVKLLDTIVQGLSRPKLEVTTRSTKTCSTCQQHYVLCECPNGTSHNSWFMKCAISVYRQIDVMKRADYRRYIESKMGADFIYGDLPYWRRLRKMKTGLYLAYFTDQRLGEKHIRENIANITKAAGVAVPALANENQRRKGYSSHSNRGSRIAHWERHVGDKMKDCEKLSLSEHKTIKQWHGYAKDGKSSIIKKRTVDKIGLLMANEIDIEERRLNNNNNNIPPTNIPPKAPTPPPPPQSTNMDEDKNDALPPYEEFIEKYLKEKYEKKLIEKDEEFKKRLAELDRRDEELKKRDLEFKKMNEELFVLKSAVGTWSGELKRLKQKEEEKKELNDQYHQLKQMQIPQQQLHLQQLQLQQPYQPNVLPPINNNIFSLPTIPTLPTLPTLPPMIQQKQQQQKAQKQQQQFKMPYLGCRGVNYQAANARNNQY